MCHASLMLLESSQGWILSSWLPGSTVYLHKEIISLSPQYTQYKLYSFLQYTRYRILSRFNRGFDDGPLMLETGLFHVSQTQRSLKTRGPEGSQPLSCPLALHTCSPAWLLVNCGGKGQRWGWKGSHADGNGFYQKVIPKLASMTLVSLDKECLLSF